MKNIRLIAIVSTVAILLCIPLIGMQFSNEVNWTLSDFIIGGGLLLSIGLACEFVLRQFPKTKHRLIICGILLLALAVIWVEMAVGLFGSPIAGS